MRTLRLMLSFALGAAACGGGGRPDTVTSGTSGGLATGAGTPAAAASPTGRPSDKLIPRAILFGNPDRRFVRLSPDGKWLSWLAEDAGVMNIWVAPRGTPDQARAVTAERSRPVPGFSWAFDSKHILYQQDVGGDENFHVFSIDVASTKAIDLTPIAGVAARVEALSERHPGHALLAINDRDPKLHDVYRVEIATGKRTLVVENSGFIGFAFDHDLMPRTAAVMTKDGGMLIKKPARKAGEWVDFQTVPAADLLTTNPIGFDKTGKIQYGLDSRGRDTAALVALDMTTGKTKLLADDPRADGAAVLVHPTTHAIEAVSFNFEREVWTVLDQKIAPDVAKLDALSKGAFTVLSRSLDDSAWIVMARRDAGSDLYYLWDRKAQKEQLLFAARKALDGLELAAMRPVVIRSRDGLDLVSYLSLPVTSDPDGDGKPTAALPMVLLVHGGPWGRDEWGFDASHQLLANRGYAVLAVNFRGSTGFGKKFVNAGDGEWAGKMHDDLLDAVKWAADHGIADPARVCIMGGSYGGYATLVGLTFTPDVFRCGVDIVGPSNLITLLETVPPYWQPMIDMFKTRVGDFTTAEGKAALTARSPLSRVDAITKPLLIGQGANDPRVKQAEADQIVAAMQKKAIPVTYVLFPDEGHGFHRPENNMAFWAVTEAFLSAYLGGEYQPYDQATFTGSTITVPTGAAAVPGLAAALAR